VPPTPTRRILQRRISTLNSGIIPTSEASSANSMNAASTLGTSKTMSDR